MTLEPHDPTLLPPGIPRPADSQPELLTEVELPPPNGTLVHPESEFGGTLRQSAESLAGVKSDAALSMPGSEILRELGRGAMGVVYQARHLRLNRTVALKMILSGGHASTDELARFQAEAEAAAKLAHPNVVPIFDTGTHNGLPYFSCEFCPGGSLSDKSRGHTMPAKDAAALVAKIAAGVQAAHDAGIIHRDLKPANILLTNDGTPKVTDFGLAKSVDSDMTRTGTVMGTPSFMAPEQAAGKGGVGPRSDVWALGGILYECLTGRPPFLGESPYVTVNLVLATDPWSTARRHGFFRDSR